MIRIHDPAQLAQILADLRAARGLSQWELAEATDWAISQAAVSHWELGQRVPGTAALIPAARALGHDLALIPRGSA